MFTHKRKVQNVAVTLRPWRYHSTSQGSPIPTKTKSWRKRVRMSFGRPVVSARGCQWGIKVWMKLTAQCSSLWTPVWLQDSNPPEMPNCTYHQHSTFNVEWQGNVTDHKGLATKLRRCFRRKLVANRASSRKQQFRPRIPINQDWLSTWEMFQGVTKPHFILWERKGLWKNSKTSLSTQQKSKPLDKPRGSGAVYKLSLPLSAIASFKSKVTSGGGDVERWLQGAGVFPSSVPDSYPTTLAILW